jgi:hypothetical protein
MVVLASIIASLFLGGLLFYSGIGKKIDKALDAKVPFYEALNINKKKIWCHPDDGLLGGEVVKMPINAPYAFTIIDCNGREWVIEEPHQIKSVIIKVGDKVKVIGKEMDEHRFEAEEFRQW